MTAPSVIESSLDLLEEKFRRVEEASERRALCQPELPGENVGGPPPEPRKHHRKPAVLESHFGKVILVLKSRALSDSHQQDEYADDSLPLLPSPLSAAASKSTFYHTLANPRSIESLVSENSRDRQDADEQLEIRVERIVGRQSLPQTVSSLLPRRLTRARSHIDIKRSTVVDISVETATEASQLPFDVHTSTAYATKPARSRAATVGVLTSHGGLVERAKGFARKLGRKSRPELP